jgi:outer membrane protein assembly factor BamB
MLIPALLALATFLAACGQVAPPKGWAAPVALASPGGSEQVVVIQTEPGKLTAIALTPSGPAERWTFPGKDDKVKLGAIYATPLLEGGKLIVAGFSGDVLALDPASGRPIIGWGGKVSGKVVSDVIVNTARDQALVATDYGAVHLVSLGSGAVAPARTTDEMRMFGSGASSGTSVIYGSLDRHIFAVKDTSGEVAWRATSDPVLGDLTATGDRVVAGIVGNQVKAYNITDGSERWAAPTTAWVWAAPLATRDTVYVADLDGIVYALDSATGVERWRTTAARGDVRGGLTLTGGLLIAATGSGAVFAVDPATGAEQWHVETGVGSLLASPLVLESGLLFVSDSGTLLRVQPSTGTHETLYKRK